MHKEHGSNFEKTVSSPGRDRDTLNNFIVQNESKFRAVANTVRPPTHFEGIETNEDPFNIVMMEISANPKLIEGTNPAAIVKQRINWRTRDSRRRQRKEDERRVIRKYNNEGVLMTQEEMIDRYAERTTEYSNEPEEFVIQDETVRRIEGYIAQLPPKHRIAFEGHRAGLSNEEIGRITGKKPNAVKTDLHRARRALKEKLKNDPSFS